MTVRRITSCDDPAWLDLRAKLWPHCPEEQHRREARQIVDHPQKAAFVLVDPGGYPMAFMELSLRDYVNGCSSSPVAFLEGIFVLPASRGRGCGRLLVAAAEEWAREHGCVELASDALISNGASHYFHLKSGFQETERVVYFKKALS